MNKKELDIEYRKIWGVASHVDNTWWETYGDKCLELGKAQTKKDILEILKQIKSDMTIHGTTYANEVIEELEQRIEKLK